MGEIRFVGTGETRRYPYLVCKKTRCDNVILDLSLHELHQIMSFKEISNDDW